MPFANELVIGAALRSRYRCEMCGRDLSKVTRFQTLPSFHIHSVTGLHLVQGDLDRSICIVTDPPERLARLRGKKLPTWGFKVFEMGRSDDGFCLCHRCHAGIHDIALNETKQYFPKYSGRNSAPGILEAVSIFFIIRGRF